MTGARDVLAVCLPAWRNVDKSAERMKRAVLAYSGGLDTSVAVRWLIEETGAEVIALCADVGQGRRLGRRSERDLAAGAVEQVVDDCRDEFAADFVAPALKGTRYEGRYPLSRRSPPGHRQASGGGRSSARRRRRGSRLHRQGNDQVRFEVSTRSLAPDIEVLALCGCGG